MTDLKRIRKEFSECKKDPATSGLDVSMPEEANLLHWKAVIKGPVGTPYEGGIFRIDIHLPPDYPFVPPKMKYETRIWHPNISSESGAICLDILKNEWSPALTIRTALISLQALMSAPEPDDPQDAVVASQYKKSLTEFNSTAKYWTETYASGASEDEAIKKLVEMGFEVEVCKAALRKFDGDENKALDSLLAGLSAGGGQQDARANASNTTATTTPPPQPSEATIPSRSSAQLQKAVAACGPCSVQ